MWSAKSVAVTADSYRSFLDSMAIAKNIISKLRSWASGDKEEVQAKAKELDRGKMGLYPGDSMTTFHGLQGALQLDNELMSRFCDYEQMDSYGEIGSALDIYADDATIPDNENRVCIWAVSQDRVVREILNHALHKT